MPTSPAIHDLPPTPNSPPAYTPSAHPPSYTPYPSTIHLGPNLFNIASVATQNGNTHLAAALREYHASQNPENWGKRPIHPRYARRPAPEVQGVFKGWAVYLLGLMSPEFPTTSQGVMYHMSAFM